MRNKILRNFFKKKEIRNENNKDKESKELFS